MIDVMTKFNCIRSPILFHQIINEIVVIILMEGYSFLNKVFTEYLIKRRVGFEPTKA